MSERTTIGGTTYETIGSSSANLLLRCNGTARIQWGNKLIDLIKNGKIASGDSSMTVSIIKDSSEIKSDGFYIIEVENDVQLWICKNGKQYNLTGLDLYISASTKQDITAEQKEQALSNIGMYYNTLDDVKKSEIKNGIVYVLEDSNLYTIKNGEIAEFEAKLKTVTVEQEKETGEIINSSFKVVLSVLDTDYIILENKKISLNQNVHISKQVQLGSEGADALSGYRLYFKNGESWLDVDHINERKVESEKEYIECTYSELRYLIANDKLESQKWYLISNYQNPWKLSNYSTTNNRPILVQALTNNSLYPLGYLLEDRTVSIKYDITFNKTVGYTSTRGLITWMKDSNNNEANFDFLDYCDGKGIPLTTLHWDTIEDSNGYTNGPKSIFPRGSYNNKLTIHNLKGIVIENEAIADTNVSIIDFKIQDSIDENEEITQDILNNLSKAVIHDNIIESFGLITSSECSKFYNNTITESGKLVFNKDCYNNTLNKIYNSTNNSILDTLAIEQLNDSTFNGIVNNTIIQEGSNSIFNGELSRSSFEVINNSSLNGKINNTSFEDILDCNIYADIIRSQFKNIDSCTIQTGTLESVNCRSNLKSLIIDSVNYPILYDTSKVKDVYYANNQFQIIEAASVGFTRGMIIMHSGLSAIPEGWAVCDGSEYTVQGEKVITPNLVGRFIKAVSSVSDIGAVNNYNEGLNNDFTLTASHLPQHSHPHNEHTHNISEITGTIENSNNLELELTNSNHIEEVTTSTTSVVKSITTEGITSETIDVISEVSTSSKDTEISGGNHTHNITISGGTIDATTSEESQQTWENKAFKIEPNYYSLIFIMKL